MPIARRHTLLLTALIAFGQGFSIAWAQDDTRDQSTVKVRADGYAEGTGRSAESAALAEAEKVAVEVVVSDIVGDRWLEELDAVFAQSAEYVRTSRPIDVDRKEVAVQVRAEVYVFEGQLRRDIAAVLFNAFPAKPSVVVLFGEQIAGYRNWTVGEGAAQRLFEKRFQEAGFLVLPTDARYSAEELLQQQSGGPGAMADFGLGVGADIVIRGDATAQEESEAQGINVSRVGATVNLDVIRPNDGAVIEKFESNAVVNGADAGMGGEQAIEDACTAIIQDVLVASVLAHATQPPPEDFLVSVSLPAEGPWLTRVRNGIGERFPMARLQDLYHSVGHARFRIGIDSTLSALVHGLTDTRFDDFSLVTQRAVGRELDLELVPNSAAPVSGDLESESG